MLMFGKQKGREKEVQRLLTRLMNLNCRAIDALREGPRGECRIDLALVVIILPAKKGRPDVDRAIATVTREISSAGMSLVVPNQIDAEKVFLVFKIDGEMTYVLGEVRHQDPIGAGLLQVGLRLLNCVYVGDYPELARLTI